MDIYALDKIYVQLSIYLLNTILLSPCKSNTKIKFVIIESYWKNKKIYTVPER